jgi:hypothetical protein
LSFTLSSVFVVVETGGSAWGDFQFGPTGLFQN